MARNRPLGCPSTPPPPGAVSIQKYTIEVVTPIFGGGVDPGTPDEIFPVSAKAVRGHLRFWWRVLYAKDLSPKDQWDREEAIFGSSRMASSVSITVEVPTTKSDDFVCPDDNYLAGCQYALFPMIEFNQKLEKASEKNGVSLRRLIREGIRFELRITWPNYHYFKRTREAQSRTAFEESQYELLKGELNGVLACWIKYGGIGGRTRRGCGALQAVGERPSLDHSIIPAAIFRHNSVKKPLDAWKFCLNAYRDFRQAPGLSPAARSPKHHKPGKPKPVAGRSHWPEADSIRLITGCSLKPKLGSPKKGGKSVDPDVDYHDHSKPTTVAGFELPAFTRAELGLPIVFHFADGPNKSTANQDRDPDNATLYPFLANGERMDRMASPVFTRPVLGSDGNWEPTILIFETQLKDGMQVGLETKASKDLYTLADVRGPRMSMLRPILGKESALEALKAYLDSHSWIKTPDRN